MTILDLCLNNPMDKLQARQLNPVSLAFAGTACMIYMCAHGLSEILAAIRINCIAWL